MSAIAFWGAVEIGLVYAFVGLGVYFSFRVLDFPDLTVDGTFPLGAAVAAVLIIGGVNPWLATLAALIAAGVAGIVTAILNPSPQRTFIGIGFAVPIESAAAAAGMPPF